MGVKQFFKDLFKDPPRALKLRNFAGADTCRLLADWILAPIKTRETLKREYQTLQLRARDLARNNEFVVGYLKNIRRNVIGDAGFRLVLNTRNAELRRDLQAYWDDYTSRAGGYITLDEKSSGRDLDDLIVRTLLVDGEVFLRKVKDPSSPYLYRWELLDALDIDYYHNATLPGGRQIVMGVELDERGREAAYYYRPGNIVYSTGPLERLDASEVIHIFRPEEAGQTRGYSPLNAVMKDLEQLDGYRESEIVRARASADLTAVLQSNGTQGADALDTETNERGEFFTEITPGMVKIVPTGYEFKPFNNGSPNGQFDAFTKSLMRGIANALGVSYPVACGDYSAVNYSSLRAAALEDRYYFKELQKFVIEAWKDLEYRLFVEALEQAGQLSKLEAVEARSHRFVGRSWSWVDPAKDLQAQKLEYQLLKRDPISELTADGIDVTAHLDSWAEWYRLLKERDLPFIDGVFNPSPAPVAEEGGNNPNE